MTDPRKLACFAGVVPFEQQSGTSLRTESRVSKMADMAIIKNQTNYKNRLELS
ncbi:transposase [Zunongwangia sp. SCSIO 43204]|uniref:transposase n=1 Tax=Zunongwangia TaxID=417127 RepID=UPI000B849DB5|nr:transposase [Zunongwangia sp. SCSIO 43204]